MPNRRCTFFRWERAIWRCPTPRKALRDRVLSATVARRKSPRGGARAVATKGQGPVPVPADGGVQRPASAGVPLHRPADPGRGEADRGEGAETVGHPPTDGDPGLGDPEVRGPDALDRRLPARDDGGPEGARRGDRLAAVLHHDAAEPAVRRVRAVAVPPPQGRRVRPDGRAPG